VPEAEPKDDPAFEHFLKLLPARLERRRVREDTIEAGNLAVIRSIRQNLDPARFAAATGLAVLPAVIEATAAPVPDDGLLRDWPAPDFGIQTHRIYMVQWYAFALLAAALWFWFHRPQAAREGHG
jgi:surfeit locus 1 family protein